MADDDDLPNEIARLEEEIDELAHAAARCRQIGLAAKAAIAVGAVWTLAIVAGLVRGDPAALVGATACLIGGIVLFGSNAGTARQTAAAMAASEARRTELIDGIAFGGRVVGWAKRRESDACPP